MVTVLVQGCNFFWLSLFFEGLRCQFRLSSSEIDIGFCSGLLTVLSNGVVVYVGLRVKKKLFEKPILRWIIICVKNIGHKYIAAFFGLSLTGWMVNLLWAPKAKWMDGGRRRLFGAFENLSIWDSQNRWCTMMKTWVQVVFLWCKYIKQGVLNQYYWWHQFES